MTLSVVLTPFVVAGAVMATVWLAHLRLKDALGLWSAQVIGGSLVLPEYALNVFATRLGFGAFTGAPMASFHFCSGVLCVALVSRFVLGKTLGVGQLFGFLLLAAGMIMVLRRG